MAMTNPWNPEHPTVVVAGWWPNRAPAHHPASVYVERMWLPLVGPSAICTARLLADLIEDSNPDDRIEVDLADLSAAIGLGTSIGANSKIHSTLRRLTRFRCAYWFDDQFELSMGWRELTTRERDRLPRLAVEGVRS